MSDGVRRFLLPGSGIRPTIMQGSRCSNLCVRTVNCSGRRSPGLARGRDLLWMAKTADGIWPDAMSCNNAAPLLLPRVLPPPSGRRPWAERKGKGIGKGAVRMHAEVPMVCSRPLAGCRFALFILLAAVSGRSPMASAIVACMCAASKVALNATTFMPLALNAGMSD